jgi:predicted small metal-binding protein
MQGRQFVAKADNEQQLLQEVAEHAAEAHGITQITPDLLTAVKAAIRTAR